MCNVKSFAHVTYNVALRTHIISCNHIAIKTKHDSLFWLPPYTLPQCTHVCVVLLADDDSQLDDMSSRVASRMTSGASRRSRAPTALGVTMATALSVPGSATGEWGVGGREGGGRS